MTTKTPMELADEIENKGMENCCYLQADIVSALRQSARREALLREAYGWLEVHCLAHDLQERIEAALGETS